MKRIKSIIAHLYFINCLEVQTKLMVRKLSLVILLLLWFTVSVNAQSKIYGKVMNADSKPVANANVLLLTPKDSSLVKGMLTKENGTYTFENIAPGKHLITSTHTGYKNTFTPIFKINDNDNVKAEPIVLNDTIVQLKDVNVTVKKPFMNKKLIVW